MFLRVFRQGKHMYAIYNIQGTVLSLFLLCLPSDHTATQTSHRTYVCLHCDVYLLPMRSTIGMYCVVVFF